MAQDSIPNDHSRERRAQGHDAAEATAVVAAIGTADSTSPLQTQMDFTIAIPPEEASQDGKLIQYLTDFVNRIYFDSEASFWTPGVKRTNAAEIKDYLSSGALALAWRGDRGISQHGDVTTDLLGCVNIKMFAADETGEFGMLACDPVSRGRGVGRELVRFAEDEARRRGASRMRLELLQGDGWRHEFKDRLEAWYCRNGYQLVRVDDVQRNWPSLAPLLARPTVMKVFIKEL